MSGLGLSPQQAPQPQPTQPMQATVEAARAGVQQILNAASGWFFWIAGLSLVNTVILITGSHWMFLAGLAITYFAAAVGIQFGSTGQVVAIFISACAGGVFLAMGMIARKGHKAAFVIGMVLYVLDAVLALVVQDWLMAAFHAYVLYRLWRGFAACSQIKAFEKDAIAGPALAG
jgi:MFS family permease